MNIFLSLLSALPIGKSFVISKFIGFLLSKGLTTLEDYNDNHWSQFVTWFEKTCPYFATAQTLTALKAVDEAIVGLLAEAVAKYGAGDADAVINHVIEQLHEGTKPPPAKAA